MLIKCYGEHDEGRISMLVGEKTLSMCTARKTRVFSLHSSDRFLDCTVMVHYTVSRLA